MKTQMVTIATQACDTKNLMSISSLDRMQSSIEVHVVDKPKDRWKQLRKVLTREELEIVVYTHTAVFPTLRRQFGYILGSFFDVSF